MGEEGKTALQVDTMAYATKGEQGTEVWREAKTRKVNKNHGGEIVLISDLNGKGMVSINPTTTVSFSKNLLFYLSCVTFSGLWGLNPPSGY